jgi:SAM-dependent methyltransferase
MISPFAIGMTPIPEPTLHAAMRRAIRHYQPLDITSRWYTSIKMNTDPCYRMVAPFIPPDSLTVDLGSGLGLLAMLLAELGEGRRVHGIEHDARKFAAASRVAAAWPSIHLELGDIRKMDIPPCQTITLLDVLHYFDGEEQRRLLLRAAAALPSKGRLLLRETDAARKGGTRFTRGFERMALAFGWNRGTRTHFRSREAWIEELTAAGFRVEVLEAANRVNPGNVLLVAEKL